MSSACDSRVWWLRRLLQWGRGALGAVTLGWMATACRCEDALKVDLLGVFAHPDDETMVAATLAKYALVEGRRVAAVYVTRGEGGGNMAGTQAGAALGILRDVELEQCLQRLGIRSHWTLGRLDFGYTENAGISLMRWGREETLRDLVRLVRALRPEVILTIHPAPTPGQHGHHQVAGRLAIEAFDAAADPLRFPEQLRVEGLVPWRPRKLYVGARTGTTSVQVGGIDVGARPLVEVTAEALSQHRSQGFGGIANAPWLRRMTQQPFLLAKSVIPDEPGETDLFRGLPVEGATPPRVGLPGDTGHAPSRAELRFLQRPALESYGRFLRANQIEHLAEEIPSDIPLVEGRPWEVSLEMINRTSDGFNTPVQFEAPPGWIVVPSPTQVRFSPLRTNRLTVDVTTPAGSALSDGWLRAKATGPDGPLETTILAHVVPRVRIPRLERSPAWNAGPDDAFTTGMARFEIAATNLWQGTTSGASDLSASVRLGHDGLVLYVQVDVRDDVVSSNIAPVDIRGHWRTDAVELCVDPEAGAAHTFGCFKLGVIPFDTLGHVGASRDADARHGPIEETAPGTLLDSWRTLGGYAVRIAVPFVELGLRYPDVRTFGLNVLVYDGDKPGAAAGENINKARIAWSPRAGVQGRPEDWGRGVLE